MRRQRGRWVRTKTLAASNLAVRDYPLRRSMRSRFICARRARFSALALATRRCSDGGW